MDRSDLAERMKGYETRNRYYLQRRMPVILRLDMRAGHSFTKGFERPFDEIFVKSMQETAKYLCENIQNCKLSYQQSDEITLLLVDYDKLNTDCFFDYRVDKLCSIAASMATIAFNRAFANNVEAESHVFTNEWLDDENFNPNYKNKELRSLWLVHKKAVDKGAMFDARCFNIPKEEVTNLVYWRQLDATRNSIQMVGQANFSHKELQNKSCNGIQDMLMTQKGINWNDLPTYQKRGSCCVRNKIVIESDGVVAIIQLRDTSKSENEWIIDTDIPIFKGEGREYIDRLVFVGEE
nr:MAG TPA: tRNAHis guanylyltransferase [Caudoviricetes sp.]